MKKYKVGACGNFDLDPSFLNGQVIRSCSIMSEVEKKMGTEQVKKISYTSWKKNPLKTFVAFVRLLAESENVILFPDLRAIYALVPLASLFKLLFNTKVYYNVIGGWLPDFLKEQKLIAFFVRKLDGLFVQTKVLSQELNGLGVQNTTVFPNFKRIRVFDESQLVQDYSKPLSLVFMSRVTDRKGVTELVNAIHQINENGIKYTLDIYGSIQEGYEEEFANLQSGFGDAIEYKGQVDPLKTSDTMFGYFLHVFPTTYYTEGYPGSVLDALSAGVPTLSARWQSYEDVLVEGKTGISFTMRDWEEMKAKLLDIYEAPETVCAMRAHCIEAAKQYAPEKIINIILEKMNVTA